MVALSLAFTKEGITKRAIKAELERIRSIGVAASLSTTIGGIAAIGAAVQTSDGTQSIGFAVSFPIIASNAALRLKMAAWVRRPPR